MGLQDICSVWPQRAGLLLVRAEVEGSSWVKTHTRVQKARRQHNYALRLTPPWQVYEPLLIRRLSAASCEGASALELDFLLDWWGHNDALEKQHLCSSATLLSLICSLLLKSGEHHRVCVGGCVFLKDMMMAYGLAIRHQSNPPTNSKTLPSGVSSPWSSAHFAQQIFLCASLWTYSTVNRQF